MQRRQFLKLAGFFSLAIHMPTSLIGCGANNTRPANGPMAFLHGVASGDPRESSVVLWTRITPLEDTSGYVDLKVEISADESFSTLIADADVRIDESSDYTLRFSISDLSSDSIYYYRFIANEEVISTIGRTWTAPQQNADVSINFASVNCQNREHAFYSAYALMLQEDLVKPREEQIRFILHLGDFIYETQNDALQYPTDEAGNRLASLVDAQGKPRTIGSFPHGETLSDGSNYAVSLSDYRHLYKTYLLDPELQAARARWPFICVWDDHEFTDDCWQSEANYDDIGIDSSTNEPSQPRKLAANQAWYEYIPVDYSQDPSSDGVSHHAHAFQASQVGTTLNDEVDENGLANNADNLAAIGSLTIYRSLRFGKNLQLILTDCRSYRSDHALPEDISGNFEDFVHSRMALPLSLVNTLDAGREANDGNPPAFLDLPLPLLNPRATSPRGTMLGMHQKQWWKEVLTQSNTTWNIWANSIPLMRLGIDLSSLPIDISDIILSSDTWDGYNSERRELMMFLHENNISNVVSIAGDLHAYYAGEVLSDYDSETNINFSIPEFVCGAISSVTQFRALDQLSLRNNPDDTEVMLRQLIIFEDKTSGEPVCNFNSTMLRGATTAIAGAQTQDANAAVENTVAPLNSHLSYADTSAHGYSLFHADADNFKTEFIVLENTGADPTSHTPQSLRRTGFNVTAQENSGQSTLQGPFISGVSPYPFDN